MIYLQLFLTFLEIGAVSFGGGFAIISMVRERALAYGWLTEEELLNLIAVSESTPGPIAVNVATFVGATQGGLLGAFLATFGVVLPSFVIILLIASILKNLLKYEGVKAFLGGIRPTVIGLIISTAGMMLLSGLFGFSKIGDVFSPDLGSIIVLAILLLAAFLIKKATKKQPSFIVMILISAALGMIVFPLMG